MWQAISQQLSDTLLFNFQITERTKVSGGDINDCYMISDGNERYFVKVNQREFLPKFEIEAENLRLLRETSTVYVPELVLIGKTKECSFIILNYLPTKPLDTGNNSFDFGVQLAQLHKWGEQKSLVVTKIIISVVRFSLTLGIRNGGVFSLNNASASNCNC